MMRVIASTAFLALATLACGQTRPAPVPLSGTPADIGALEGEWAGEYHSYEPSGRSGTIFFRLSSRQDTARGHVLMHIAGSEAAGVIPLNDPWGSVPDEELLTVTFIRAAGGTVFGRLDPYSDPVCGCEMKTTFTGRIKGNLVEGVYTSEHVNGGDRQEGRWRVLRTFPDR